MKNEEEFKDYFEAERVASSVRAVAEDAVKPGVKLLDVATEIEEETENAGAALAFPVNLSINEVAAHYSPAPGEETVFTEEDVVKVDFGVHVNGCIIDQAFTADLTGEHGKLVEASEKALENAVKTIKPGVMNGEVGRVIQETIEGYGFKPIENLSGHQLEPYVLHAGESVPNTAGGDYEFREGDVFAIEPFATTGAGRVEERMTNKTQIYSLVNPKPVRLPQSRALLNWAVSERQALPFSKRAAYPKVINSKPSLELALHDLIRQNVLREYPPLVEINKGVVSQAETTVIVEADGAKQLT